MAWDHRYKSLGELVYDRIESRTAIGPEWDQLCKWFGFEKLEREYEAEKLRRSQATVSNPPNFQDSAEKLEW